jgi:hypothetical protein
MENTLLSLAQVSVAYGDVTSGRLRALVAVAAGLISVVLSLIGTVVGARRAWMSAS